MKDTYYAFSMPGSIFCIPNARERERATSTITNKQRLKQNLTLEQTFQYTLTTNQDWTKKQETSWTPERRQIKEEGSEIGQKIHYFQQRSTKFKIHCWGRKRQTVIFAYAFFTAKLFKSRCVYYTSRKKNSENLITMTSGVGVHVYTAFSVIWTLYLRCVLCRSMYYI